MPTTPSSSFGTANWIVLLVYLVAMLLVGFLCHKRVTSVRAFFMAEGKLNHVLVGLSLLGTYLSAITMMTLPANAYGDADWTFAIQPPFLIVTAFVITRFVLPHYRAAGVISVYQYLEQRIHVTARLLAASSFVLFSMARMGLVLFLPALALAELTGVDVRIMILLMGVVTTVYCIVGGFEAVVWTDAIQVLVFVVAALASVGYVLDAAGPEFLAVAAADGKFRLVEPLVRDASFWVKASTLWLILETLFQTIRIYGTQQDMTQRYVATESTAKANRSVWISILGYIPLAWLFYFIGTALYVHYKLHPAPLPESKDSLYPFFVSTAMPPGVAGLVIAGIFAASMSTISSLMNSSSTVCVEDFYRRFSRRERPDAHYLKVARWLTAAWGVAHILMAFNLIGSQDGLIVWQKIMGIFTNGVLGLMALAFLRQRVHRHAATIGFVASYLMLLAMMFPISNAGGAVAGLLGKPWFMIVGAAVVALLPCWRRELVARIAALAAYGLLYGFLVWVLTFQEPMVWLLWPVFGNLGCFVLALCLNAAFPPTKAR